jgi:restriction system protein
MRDDARVGSGPRFLRFFWPIVTALREAGGAGSPRDIVDRAIELVGIDDDERAERTASGALRVDNQAHWARNYLVWAGLLDGSTRGRWALTTAGWKLPLDEQSTQTAYDLFKRVRLEKEGEWREQDSVSDERSLEEAAPIPLDSSDSDEATLAAGLRQTLLSLTPGGFENLCKQLLSRLGLVQLRAVGRAGDRGIDVEGHLRVSSVVSFRVGVQCKLYGDGNKIVPKQIREFQGALGPFDRGIYMTTSVFTQQAEEQAALPGYKPVDLIDGERLIELLREHGLGIRQVTVIDSEFFEPFR